MRIFCRNAFDSAELLYFSERACATHVQQRRRIRNHEDDEACVICCVFRGKRKRRFRWNWMVPHCKAYNRGFEELLDIESYRRFSFLSTRSKHVRKDKQTNKQFNKIRFERWMFAKPKLNKKHKHKLPQKHVGRDKKKCKEIKCTHNKM